MGSGHPLGVHCPRCGNEIVVRGGSVGAILAEALKLRAELGSVGLTCEACGFDFLYHAKSEGDARADSGSSETRPASEVENQEPKSGED